METERPGMDGWLLILGMSFIPAVLGAFVPSAERTVDSRLMGNDANGMPGCADPGGERDVWVASWIADQSNSVILSCCRDR